MIFTWNLRALPQTTGSKNIIWLISQKRLLNGVKSIFYEAKITKVRFDLEWYKYGILNQNRDTMAWYFFQIILFCKISIAYFYTVYFMLRIFKKFRVKMCVEFDKMSSISVT